jgi:hypothetical protein
MAEEARRRVRSAGRTPRGHFLWTADEDEIVKRTYPDYIGLQKILRRRTYYALRNRARFLNIVKRRHVWKNHEIIQLRRLYLRASTNELRSAFPNMTWHQISGKARHIGLRGRKPKLKETGYTLIDAIRTRAAARGWSMVDLDAIAGTKCFFQKASWHTSNPNHGAVLKAIAVLEGEVSIHWQ